MVLYQKKPENKDSIVLTSLASLAFLIVAGNASLKHLEPMNTNDQRSSNSHRPKSLATSRPQRVSSVSVSHRPRPSRDSTLRPSDPFETMEGILADSPFAVTLFNQLDFPITVCYDVSTGDCYTSNEGHVAYLPGRTCFTNPFAAVYSLNTTAFQDLSSRFATHKFLLEHPLSPQAAIVTDFISQEAEGDIYTLEALSSSQVSEESDTIYSARHALARWVEDFDTAAQNSDTKRFEELATLFTPGARDENCRMFRHYASSQARCELDEVMGPQYSLSLLVGNSGY